METVNLKKLEMYIDQITDPSFYLLDYPQDDELEENIPALRELLIYGKRLQLENKIAIPEDLNQLQSKAIHPGDARVVVRDNHQLLKRLITLYEMGLR